ncbi:rhomboid family intramembrane serine protease [Candidatus Curtissbacteria bacterium]|nr:rhomboid family intramembrane serine protease [Candidatus Curtissbacteria bacterium]
MFPIRDSHSSGKFPIINLALIVANLYVFYYQLITPDIDLFIATYALIPQNINFLNFETLRPFVTSMFLHAGFLHILSNMWFLWIFGDNVEAAVGHVKYLFFYIFCGVSASFVQYLFISGSTLPMVGASGAIAAVLGAYLKFFPRHSIDTLIPVFGFPAVVAIPASFMLVYWFITQAFSGVATILVASASVGGVAYVAHAGGFATGFIFAKYFTWPQHTQVVKE